MEHSIALVTGTTSGLGYAAARMLAAEGWREIIVTGRSLARVQETAAQLAAETKTQVFTPLELDLDTPSSVQSALAELVKRGRPIDFLLLNAGMVPGKKRVLTAAGVEAAQAPLIGHHQPSKGETDVAPEALDQVADAATIAAWAKRIARLHVAPEVRRYIVDIADATRHHRDLLLGASPRGALAIQRASRALAASIGRSYVVPDDVKTLAPIVLEHRIVLSPEAQMRGVEPSEVIRGVLDSVPIPGTRAI